ncbi:MAG: hypothetical protein IJR58_07545 [Lachnospiraceae bacterium]|nr:hypothetical protein [Lachnospiraceae bacterium]MBR0092490.1 hypothetical protein [Lachnospiraceae bacterium]
MDEPKQAFSAKRLLQAERRRARRSPQGLKKPEVCGIAVFSQIHTACRTTLAEKCVESRFFRKTTQKNREVYDVIHQESRNVKEATGSREPFDPGAIGKCA